MASEITLSFGFSATKSSLKYSNPSHSLLVDLTGTRYLVNCQRVGTADEALVVGDLATAGYMWAKNLDPTNYIQIGLAASYTIRLKALQELLVPIDTLSLFAKANTAECLLQYVIFEA